MKKHKKRIGMFFMCALVGLSAVSAVAQDDLEEADDIEAEMEFIDIEAEMEKDKTGTNPINFTFDARVYHEYQWLNTEGDGDQNITTFEFRAPLGEGKWQYRMKMRYQDLEADLNDDGFDDLDESGMGDMDIRFLTVPYLNIEKKAAFAYGLEMFLPTASEDALGSGAWVMGPQLFGVFFDVFGMFDLIAPGYQHRFSIDEDSGRDNVHQSVFDLFVLKMSKNKQRWFLNQSTLVVDYENDIEFMQVDLEFGMMLDKFFGTKGHSAYIRPGFGIGSDRPQDASVEIGYKVVW